MKKVKTNNKMQQKAPMKNSTKAILYGLAGIALLATIIIIIIEGATGMTVTNKSSKKIEYIEAYYVDMEGPVTGEVMLFEDFESGDKSTISTEKIDLKYREANLEIRFKFEGQDEELFVDAGYFNDDFDGKIALTFSDTEDDKVILKVKASAGILPSPLIRCNEEHIINLAEGYVEE